MTLFPLKFCVINSKSIQVSREVRRKNLGSSVKKENLMTGRYVSGRFGLFFTAAICIFILSVQAFSQGAAGELITRAKTSIAKGELDSAIRDLTEAVRIEPNNDNAYAQRSRAYFLSNKPDAALADAEKALSINPKDTEALNMRGLVKRLRNQNVSAIADFTQAIAIDPAFIKPYMNRAETWLNEREYAKAADDSNTLIKLNPNFDSAYVTRGRVMRSLKQYDAAVNDFTKAIELNPKNEQAYYYRGLTVESKPNADWKAALADFTKATEINPNYAIAYRGQASVYNVFANDYRQGSAAASKALLVNPNDSDAYTQRGYSRTMLKEWQGAADDYTQAIKLGDNDSSTYIGRAQAYYNLNNYSAAVTDLRKVVELDPNDAESKKNLEFMTKLAQQNAPVVTAQPTAEAEAEYKGYEAEMSRLSDQQKEKSNALKAQALTSKDIPALCRMNAEISAINDKMEALALKMESLVLAGKVEDNPSKNSLIMGRKTMVNARLFDIHNSQGKAQDFNQKQGCATNK